MADSGIEFARMESDPGNHNPLDSEVKVDPESGGPATRYLAGEPDDAMMEVKKKKKRRKIQVNQNTHNKPQRLMVVMAAVTH